MAVRSTRLFGPGGITDVVSTVYTVPAGRTALFRAIHIANTTANVIVVQFFINGTGADRVVTHSTIQPNSSPSLGLVLMVGGETLHARILSGATGGVQISGHGSLLLGLPV